MDSQMDSSYPADGHQATFNNMNKKLTTDRKQTNDES